MKKQKICVQKLSKPMGISLGKAYTLVKQPGFPKINVGTRILIPIEAYKFWLNTQSKATNNTNQL